MAIGLAAASATTLAAGVLLAVPFVAPATGLFGWSTALAGPLAVLAAILLFVGMRTEQDERRREHYRRTVPKLVLTGLAGTVLFVVGRVLAPW